MNKWEILIIDDQELVIEALKRLLRKEPYNIYTATRITEAMRIIQEKDIHLIITDQLMPDMLGTTFLKEAKKIRPDAIRTVISGFADAKTIIEAINQGEISHFFTKPWDENELKTGIRSCLSQYELNMEIKELVSDFYLKRTELINHIEKKYFRECVEDSKKSLFKAFMLYPNPLVIFNDKGLMEFANISAYSNQEVIGEINSGVSIQNMLKKHVTENLDDIYKLSDFSMRLCINNKNFILRINQFTNLNENYFCLTIKDIPNDKN
ncbi:MAG: response regulator receiver protein [uncultured bacterium]|nr:MAG: response regulator receiver protein [uncultured bacterium]